MNAKAGPVVVEIGGGMVPTFVARGIAYENAACGSPIQDGRIIVVEPRLRAGVGTAWDTDRPRLLTNMASPTLKIYGALNADQDGFDIHRARELLDPPLALGGQQAYVQRGIVGDRFAEIFQETKPIAARFGFSLEHKRDLAVRVAREKPGFRVDLLGGESLYADCVILSLGLLSVDRYPALASTPGYRANPWAPGDLLSDISDDQRVGIVGMGPTAIDLVLQLAHRDLRHPVHLVSPSGRLPAVRPISHLTQRPGFVDEILLRLYGENKPFSPELIDFIIFTILERFGVTLANLQAHYALYKGDGREMIERTLAMSDAPQPLFEALKVIDELSSTIWQWSSKAGQAHIMRRWARLHALFSYAIPPTNAIALLSQISSGRIVVHGGLKTVTYRKSKYMIDLAPRHGPTRMDAVDVLINATGFLGRLANINNDLVRSLLTSGLLFEAKYGGARMDYETGQALDRDGRRIDGLFIAGGSLTRSAGYVVNSIARSSQHGISVGMSCARYLQILAGAGDAAQAAHAGEWAFTI